MLEPLLVALILIAIVGAVLWGLTTLVPLPPPVKTIIYVIGTIIMLVILLHVVTGGNLGLGRL